MIKIHLTDSQSLKVIGGWVILSWVSITMWKISVVETLFLKKFIKRFLIKILSKVLQKALESDQYEMIGINMKT